LFFNKIIIAVLIRMKIASTYLFVILFSLSFTLHAQTASLTIGTVSACGGQDVIVPVTAENLFNVGAIGLHIGFDSNKMAFRSIENINLQLLGFSSSLMVNPPRVGFAWSNPTNPASFNPGKLFDLVFTATAFPVTIDFTNDCEISSASVPPETIQINWLNGAVISGEPVISQDPDDTVVQANQNASFHVNSTNTSDFFWKESHDNGNSWITLEDNGIYSGTHTGSLTLSQVPANYNGYIYKCTLVNGLCQLTSGIATLLVDSISSINDSQNKSKHYFKNYPNPFSGISQIEYSVPERGNIHIFVTDCTGKILEDLTDAFQDKGMYSIYFNANRFSPGIYYCRLNFSSSKNHFSESLKMILLPPERKKN
jgi:hypothetical protein